MRWLFATPFKAFECEFHIPESRRSHQQKEAVIPAVRPWPRPREPVLSLRLAAAAVQRKQSAPAKHGAGAAHRTLSQRSTRTGVPSLTLANRSVMSAFNILMHP